MAAQDIANPGDAKNGSLSEKGIYRFPAFTEGTIVFRNGGNMAAKLNYNITMDEMPLLIRPLLIISVLARIVFIMIKAISKP